MTIPQTRGLGSGKRDIDLVLGSSSSLVRVRDTWVTGVYLLTGHYIVLVFYLDLGSAGLGIGVVNLFADVQENMLVEREDTCICIAGIDVMREGLLR